MEALVAKTMIYGYIRRSSDNILCQTCYNNNHFRFNPHTHEWCLNDHHHNGYAQDIKQIACRNSFVQEKNHNNFVYI